MKKTYKTTISVWQKKPYGDDGPELVFEFLEDTLTARQFTAVLDGALENAGRPYEIMLKEIIVHED